MKKGALFTIDAVLGVALAFIFILFIFSNMAKVQPVQNEIDYVARDAVNVLLINGSLKEGIADTSEIQLFLNLMPEQICGSVFLYDSANLELSNTTKTGCTTDRKKTVAWTSFVDGATNYAAKGGVLDTMKKGIIFSLLSVIFFVSLLTFSSFLAEEAQIEEDLYIDTFSYANERSLEKQIAINLAELSGVEIANISYDDGSQIYFNNLTRLGTTYSLTSYETYLEGTYDDLVNQEITIDNAGTDMIIKPFNTNVTTNENLSMTFEAAVPNITINLYSSTDYDLPLTSADDGGSNPSITVNVFDLNNNPIFSSTVQQDITQNNGDIGMSNTTNGDTVFVNIGRNGILNVNSTNAVFVSDVVLDYAAAENVVIYSQTELSLDKKQGRIELFS